MKRTAFLCIFTACALGCVSFDSDDKVSWLQNGRLSIMKPAPSASESSGFSLPGFIPSNVGKKGAWLSINTRSGEIALMEDEKASFSTTTPVSQLTLKSGTYTVAHKQRNPLWHAGEAYFKARGLEVPRDGDRIRFLKGALGDFALFIDDETPIHSGAVFTEEVGGVRLSDIDMSKIYYSLQVGDRIEVK